MMQTGQTDSTEGELQKNAIPADPQNSQPLITVPGTAKRVHLLTVYPSPTNNLKFDPTFADTNELFLYCIPLARAMDFIQFMLAIICILYILAHAAAIYVIIHTGSTTIRILTAVGIYFAVNLFLMKCFCFKQCYYFRKKSSFDARWYHKFGSKLYYGLGANIIITVFFGGVAIIIGAVSSITLYNGAESLHFHSLLLHITMITLGVTSVIECTVGIVAFSKLPNYFKQYSYRRFQLTSDEKYCLWMYIYSTNCVVCCTSDSESNTPIDLKMNRSEMDLGCVFPFANVILVIAGLVSAYKVVAYWPNYFSQLIMVFFGALHFGPAYWGFQFGKTYTMVVQNLNINDQLIDINVCHHYHVQAVRSQLAYFGLMSFYLVFWIYFAFEQAGWGDIASFVSSIYGIYRVAALCLNVKALAENKGDGNGKNTVDDLMTVKVGQK